jgi:hypothetical protein
MNVVSELREQSVAPLPSREALGHVRVTVVKVHAYNSAKALNLDSFQGWAGAEANQVISIG